MTEVDRRRHLNSVFITALIYNMVWVNISEIVRYFGLVRPMIHDTFPGQENLAAVTPSIFMSWMVWDTILILAGTGFYWLYLKAFGRTKTNALLSATAFSMTVFGLLWLGLVNMGFVPAKFIWSALPLAWIEQVIAALIVYWCFKKKSA